MTETPLVIDMGMRVGPATGMPTWTEQGELRMVIHAGHGEFPRIVLAPSDAAECYTMTIEAFNLADRYQTPVFLLTDKYLNETQWCAPIAQFKEKRLLTAVKLLMKASFPPTDRLSGIALNVDDGVSPQKCSSG